MPAELDSCVESVMKKGKSKSQAYAICSKRTGWVRKKGGGWKKRGKKK